MAYPSINDTDFNEKILNRKEFHTFKPDRTGLQKIPGSVNDGKNKGLLSRVISVLEDKIIPREEMENGLRDNDFLKSHSYQNFVTNFQNPNTSFTRLMIKWDPGLGKTIGALEIAMNFLEYYRRETEMGVEEVGSIFILGYSHHVFKSDLIKYPAFGFISHEELKRYAQLRRFAESGSSFDMERLHEFIVRINKRFGNRKRNGFFKFYGYKEFVNRIFVFSSKAKKRKSLNTMSETEILSALKSGEMKFNTELIESFKNSLIICDEIHNVYNSYEKNNWGTAIQAVLDSQPSARAIFLSATPIINNPSECIDVANLLLLPDQRLNKRDFFDNNEELLPGALEKLAVIFRGRVSYTRNQNPKLFPEKIIVGEAIPDLPYLRFIRCPMSEYHYDTYKKVFNGSIAQDSQYLNDFCLPNPDYETDKIGLFSTEIVRQKLRKSTQRWRDQNKIDFTDEILNGEFMQLPGLQKFSNKYATAMRDIRFMIQHGILGKALIYHNSVQMSGVLFIQEMLKQNGFIDETSNPNDSTLCQLCGHEKREHKKYTKNVISIKSSAFDLDDENSGITATNNSDDEMSEASDDDLIVDNIEGGDLITDDIVEDNSVQLSGVDGGSVDGDDGDGVDGAGPFGGYFEFDGSSSVSGGTRRAVQVGFEDEANMIAQNIDASKLRKEMDIKFNMPHEFVPARFAMAHSRIDNNQVRKSIDAFNSPQNTEGRRCCIMVGSRKIKESYDFKAIRNLLVLGKPDNIPILIQIIGRAIRSGSHILLPPDQRKVYVRLYTSAIPEKTMIVDHTKSKHSIYRLSYEEEKYRSKVKSYITIQKIERVMHENAVDSITNRDIIFSAEEVASKEKLKSNLGTLWFEPAIDESKFKNLSLQSLNTDTFDVYYAKSEVETITMMIKRMFIESQPVWRYKELLDAVRNPPTSWDIAFNAKLFSEPNFQIALNKLIWTAKKDYFMGSDTTKSKGKTPESDYIEPIIETEYTELEPFNRLMNPDDKLITLVNGQRSIVCQFGDYYILFPMEENGKPSIDIEMPYRNITSEQHVSVDVLQYLEDRPTLQDYSTKKQKFKSKYLGRTVEEMQAAICDYGADFHQALLEECILYSFNIWTTGVAPKLSEKSGESLHDFYFKMLAYYDLIGLIIWAAGAKKSVLDRYRTYITKPIKLYRLDLKKDIGLEIDEVKNLNKMGITVDNDPISSGSDTTDSENELNKSDIVRILKSTIRKSRCDWLPNEQKRRFYKSLSATIELSHENAKEFSKKGVPANILAIGHFMRKIPRFYHPELGWYEVPDYISSTTVRWKENPIIIGYDEKSRTGVHVRFKIRNPIQNVKQYKDTRKIEKGSVCNSKSKEYLFDVARQLKIDIPSKLNVGTLCDIIRARLIRNEIEERKKIDSNVKWFYHYFDNTRPETMMDADDNGTETSE